MEYVLILDKFIHVHAMIRVGHRSTFILSFELGIHFKSQWIFHSVSNWLSIHLECYLARPGKVLHTIYNDVLNVKYQGLL